MRFNGPEYNPAVDDERLSRQHIRIRDLMLDHVWRTLDEIAAATGDPPASVSAQLRHLRKRRFGAYAVDRRARGDRAHGLFEYRVGELGSAVAPSLTGLCACSLGAIAKGCPMGRVAGWHARRDEVLIYVDITPALRAEIKAERAKRGSR